MQKEGANTHKLVLICFVKIQLHLYHINKLNFAYKYIIFKGKLTQSTIYFQELVLIIKVALFTFCAFLWKIVNSTDNPLTNYFTN